MPGVFAEFLRSRITGRGEINHSPAEDDCRRLYRVVTLRRIPMSQDLREVLQILRFELNYLEQGGFERDRALLGTQSPFLGTFACINFGDPLRRYACRDCCLHQFVPEDKQNEEFPCHYIPLTSSGETIASLIEKNDPGRLVIALEHWLRSTIARLEALEHKEL
jgi:hypothetical protein